MLNTFHMI